MPTYFPNPGFEEEFLASDQALEMVAALAEKAAPVAEQLAPKDHEYLADSIKADAGVVDGVATGRVNAHDFKAHWHEFGTQHHPAQPYLRPAMSAVTGKPLKGGDRR